MKTTNWKLSTETKNKTKRNRNGTIFFLTKKKTAYEIVNNKTCCKNKRNKWINSLAVRAYNLATVKQVWKLREMQKFVVKKSKSAPIATSSSQPSQLKASLCSDEKTMPSNASTAKLNSTESAAVCKSDVTPIQPVIRTAIAATTSPSTATSHVKMSGYLKKKRNVRERKCVNINIGHRNVKHYN